MSDSSLLHAIAGAGAGCASLAITYPLYARMIRQQIDEKQHKSTDEPTSTLSSSSLSSSSTPTPTPTSLIPTLTSLRRQLEQHFAGLPAALFAITVQSWFYYYFFQLFKNVHSITTSPVGQLVAGSEAGIATVLLTNPLWVINSRQITKKSPALISTMASTSSQAVVSQATLAPSEISVTSCSNSASTTPSTSPSSPTSSSSSASSSPNEVSMSDVSFFHAFRLLVEREGLAGIYSGVGPALALVSSPALQFASYEYFKLLILRYRRHGSAPSASAASLLTPLDFFLLGGLSKIFATVITYPIQTMKAVLQKDGSPYSNLNWFTALIQCTKDMYHSQQGVASFYRGFKAKILQTSLTAAFLFLIRERLIQLLTLISTATTTTKKLVK